MLSSPLRGIGRKSYLSGTAAICWANAAFGSRSLAVTSTWSGQRGSWRLAAGDVTAFLTAGSWRLAPKTAQRLATALRSLLRFWYVEGLLSEPLDRAVPKVANRRSALLRGLEPAQVQALLASCDRQTADGRRDLAMLILLARMGLRAGEVAGLGLDDIDWRRGEITIRARETATTGSRCQPIRVRRSRTGCSMVGFPPRWIAAYLPEIKAPHQGLTSGRVTQAVVAAARRAGLGMI